MKIAMLHLGLLILHTADLWTTSMVSPGQEANPIMRSLWVNNGFGVLILAKGAVWAFMLAYHLALVKWLPDFSKAVWVSQLIGLIAMMGLVTWNVLMVF